MPTLITREDFTPWEDAMMFVYPERIIFWDPSIDRACMLYWETEGATLANEYIVSEGIGTDGSEIIFKYSLTETGPFQGVTTLQEFRERCDELLYKTDEMLSNTRLKN